MIIQRVHFRGFGRFTDYEIEFQPGFNIVQAPNESGKSTLLQGIFALLYGGAQEGKRVRRDAQWYHAYRPWIAEQYGGEIDYTIHDTAYRLVRNLQKGREQEQLWNRVTGEELHEKYAFDQRKERKIIETQTGLSGELFRRSAYVTSYSPVSSLSEKQEKKWQLKLAEKLNSLVDQGDEIELSSLLNHLDEQLNDIGKTANAKQKPYGMLVDKKQKLEEELEKEREIQAEYRQMRSDLQCLFEEKDQLEREYHILSEQHQRLSIALQCKAEWYRLDKLYTAYEEWKNANQNHTYIQEQIKRKEEKKQALEPPFRMQVEDLEEINGLHYQLQTFEKRIAQLEMQIQPEDQQTMHSLPWWKPLYPVWIIVSCLITVCSLFVSLPVGIGFGLLTVLIWVIPHWELHRNAKIERQNRHWSIQTNKKMVNEYQIEYKVCKDRLDWWKQNVGTNDTDVIREWWKLTQEVEKLEWEKDQLIRNQPAVKKGEGKYLQQKWVEGRAEMVAKYKGAYCQISDKQIDSESLTLARESVHKSMQLNSMQIGEKQKSLQQLEERLQELGQYHLEWEQANEKLEQIKEEKEALELAQDVLQEAYRSRQGNVAPILQTLSSSWISTITNHKYDCLYPDFSGKTLCARIPETGKRESVDQLSTGTLMQMVFALKLSIVQYIASESKQSLPILLDDCFVYYDQKRLSKVLPLLMELSKKHQILLCTCHTREQEQLDQMGQMYHQILLTS